MSTTLLLLCAGATRSDRAAAFGDALEGLDDGGRRMAARGRIEPRFRDHVQTSPSRAALETAAALGLTGQVEVALRNIDHGDWAGRAFETVHREAPAALHDWLRDPTQATPGGESLSSVRQRIAVWLDAVAAADRAQTAITHQMPIRAVLAHALDLPLSSTLSIDIAPLSAVRLSFNGRWRLQALGALISKSAA